MDEPNCSQLNEGRPKTRSVQAEEVRHTQDPPGYSSVMERSARVLPSARTQVDEGVLSYKDQVRPEPEVHEHQQSQTENFKFIDRQAKRPKDVEFKDQVRGPQEGRASQPKPPSSGREPNEPNELPPPTSPPVSRGNTNIPFATEVENIVDPEEANRNLQFKKSLLIALTVIICVVSIAVAVGVALGTQSNPSPVVPPSSQPPTLSLSNRPTVAPEPGSLPPVDVFPTDLPTPAPTGPRVPTSEPTLAPTKAPVPTDLPTGAPSQNPTRAPTAFNEQGNRIFLSTQELYSAVDFYFSNATLTLQYGANISEWDVSRISNFNRLFDANRNHSLFCFLSGCKSYPLTESLSHWNTSNARSMKAMFIRANQFNGDISRWDVRRVTSFESMFEGAVAFNQDLSQWQTSSATNMAKMFYSGGYENASTFNGDISTFDTSKVTSMESMFHFAPFFNQDVSRWDTSSVTNMDYLFAAGIDGNSVFNPDVSRWNTSSVTRCGFVFAGLHVFNKDICKLLE